MGLCVDWLHYEGLGQQFLGEQEVWFECVFVLVNFLRCVVQWARSDTKLASCFAGPTNTLSSVLFHGLLNSLIVFNIAVRVDSSLRIMCPAKLMVSPT